jgi:hypothetical protein
MAKADERVIGGKLKLLERLLVAVVAIVMAGVLGPAQSETAGQISLAPFVQENPVRYTGSSVSIPPSYVDVLGYSAGAENWMASMGAVATGLMHTAAPGAALIPGTDGSASALGPVSFSNAAENTWLSVLAPSGLSARTPDTVHGRPRDESSLSATALPESDGWKTLLCGLVVVAFMARRKTSLAAT